MTPAQNAYCLRYIRRQLLLMLGLVRPDFVAVDTQRDAAEANPWRPPNPLGKTTLDEALADRGESQSGHWRKAR